MEEKMRKQDVNAVFTYLCMYLHVPYMYMYSVYMYLGGYCVCSVHVLYSVHLVCSHDSLLSSPLPLSAATSSAAHGKHHRLFGTDQFGATRHR